MCFEHLHESAKQGELILIDGGFCRYHIRKDGQCTIHELISQKLGAGLAILDRLSALNCRFLLAKCPVDFPSNAWYKRRGFVRIATETTSSGRQLNVWNYWL
jgi:hypothetical protein